MRKLRAAEGVLARTYADLNARLDPLGKRNLERSQTAWLQFRAAECDLDTGNDPSQPGSGGTIMPMLLDECAVSLTEQRTRDLKDQLKCPGGDLSCEN